MEKKFKLWILLVITISLVYLAFSNRYKTYPPFINFESQSVESVLYKYDKWTNQWTGELRVWTIVDKKEKVMKFTF